MDQKLEDFVSLLRRGAPEAGTPPPSRRPPAIAEARRHMRAAPPPAAPRLRLPGPKVWLALGAGGAALAVLAAVAWLALPVARPPKPAATMAASAPPEPSHERVAVVPGKITLPFPATAPDEQGEMTTPDPDRATPAPLPPPAAGEKVAILPPPPAPAPRPGEPAWLRFAVPAPPADGRPRIAIVIDDCGLDKKRTERAIALKGPLTLSFLPYATDLPRMTEEAHRNGHELLVHVPMEPISRAEDMGPNGLAVNLGAAEVLRRLRWDLGRFDGYVGINNHMGSRFTGDAASMTPVIEELKARGLMFLDSRTIGNSAGVELARRFGVPHAARDVFLDNEISDGAIAQELAEVEQVARHHGSAVAIGHPHDATLDELTPWIQSLPRKGFVLVPISAIAKENARPGGTG
jgi:polysaccharide deacetylase 2 family uncharacterized protein YibQ